MKGGTSGPAVVAGDPDASLLIARVVGEKGARMPLAGAPLTTAEVTVLRQWIGEGAEWNGAGEVAYRIAPLAPRRPLIDRSAANALDTLLASYLQRHKIAPPPPVTDAVFARRAYLDVWGLLPTPEQLSGFLADRDKHKRERLVDMLLSERKHYSENWISFWNDLLHNEEGVNYAGGARKPITTWLHGALAENMPYDRMVSSLLNPSGKDAPEGFLIGVNWGGEASASQTPPMQAAQNSAQVFLGVNLKCAGCHDSFVSRWKLRETYGLASYFSKEPLEIYRCDVSTGEKSSPSFLFSELAHEPVPESLDARRAIAAKLITSPENGRFARTVVNRYWRKLLGRGLVEPPDDLDAEPWDADLLDWLAVDFVDNGYDLKLLLRRIMTSRAYQMPSVAAPANAHDPYIFRGPVSRRLTAEQFVDAVSSLTGEWRALPNNDGRPTSYGRDWRLESNPLTRSLGRPIRDQVYTDRNQDATTLQALELVNGRTLATLLRRGAVRLHEGASTAAPLNIFDSGIVGSSPDAKTVADIDIDISGVPELWLLIEDAGTRDRAKTIAGWSEAQLITSDGSSVPLSALPAAPGTRAAQIRTKDERRRESVIAPVPSAIRYDISGKNFVRFRATAAVDADSLIYHIAARVRFFIFGSRPDPQQLVRVEGEVPVPRPPPSLRGDALIGRVYRHALSREPNESEVAIAREFLLDGGAEGVEDLLWAILMSPEFQLVQ